MANKAKKTKKNNIFLTILIIIRNLAFTIVAVMAIMFMGNIYFKKPDPQQVIPDIKNTKNQQGSNPNKPKYDFSKELKQRDAEVKATVKQRIETNDKLQSQRRGQNWRVQIGSFKDRDNADRLRAKMILRDYPVQLSEQKTAQGNMFIVQVGPYYSQAEALRIKNRLQKEDAIKDLEIRQYKN